MNKKLLLTSALCGSVMLSGAALSETKITGGMVMTYQSNSEAVTANSTQGMGRETQINVSKSGDLNNGMKYAAGFALEFDGASEGSSTSNENVHINIISGNTTVHFGLDHMPNTSQSAAPRVAEHASTALGQLSTSSEIYAYHPGGKIKESFAVGVIQKINGGFVAASYVPKVGDAGGNDESIDTSAENGAYNIIYNGNFGVDGLSIKAAYQKEEAINTARRDIKVLQYGAGYNFGKFAVGVQVNDEENATRGLDDKSYEVGATVALTDKLSAGLTYIETDRSTAVVDEEILMASIGYNLGPIAVTASYTEVENIGGARKAAGASDVEAVNIRAAVKF
jgi:hypothetical protein